MGPLIDIDLDAWRKILDVNLTGALLTATSRVARHMRGPVGHRPMHPPPP